MGKTVWRPGMPVRAVIRNRFGRPSPIVGRVDMVLENDFLRIQPDRRRHGLRPPLVCKVDEVEPLNESAHVAPLGDVSGAKGAGSGG